MKRKLVILTSDGGGGQASVAQALERSLKDHYTVTIRCAFTDILNQLDPLQKITFGKYTAEDMYNTVSTYKSLWAIHSVIYKIGTLYYKFFFKRIEKRFTAFFTDEKIDAVISIIPIINKPILAAAEQVGIPFLIFSPDINPEMYLEYLDGIEPKVPCALATPFNHQFVVDLARKKYLPKDFVHEVGFPLRAAFTEKKNIRDLKKQYDIPEDKPIITVLLGSLGSPSLLTFTEYFIKVKHPIHLILCTGRYESVKKDLNKLVFPPHITRTIVGYTKHMDDFIRMSDIYFTKSGSVSVGEALYLNTPLLLNASGTIFPWERFNHVFIEEKGFGKSIKQYADIPRTIDALLAHDNKKLAAMQERIQTFEKKDGNKEILALLEKLFEAAPFFLAHETKQQTHRLIKKKA